MLLSAIIWTLSFHYYCQINYTVAVQMKNAIISIVYNKMLRLSNKARRNFTSGEITNYISVDAQRIIDSMPYIAFLWTTPYNVALSLYFLYQQLGSAAFAGLGVLVVLLPLNAWGSKIGENVMQKQMEQKDSRYCTIICKGDKS